MVFHSALVSLPDSFSSLSWALFALWVLPLRWEPKENANTTMSESFKQTPLSWAAKGGHEQVVMLLLGRKDVDPNMAGRSGRTPHSWAADYGHDGVVKLLLGRRDINPDFLDNDGRTPLSCAARLGHHEVVKLLLESGDVNPI